MQTAGAAQLIPLPALPEASPSPTDDAPRVGTSPRHFKVRHENGDEVVAREYGRRDGKLVLLLPDGQLGIPNMLVPTEAPFRPYSSDELLPRLKKGSLL